MSSKNILIKYLLILAGVILIVIILSYLLFEQKYQNKIYPGISLGNIDLGDLTKIEAKNLLNQKINQLNQNGIIFVYNKNNTALNAQNNQWRMTSVMPIIHSFDNDLAYQIIFFDVQQAVESAYSNSRDNDFWLNLRNKIETLIYKKQISIMHTIDEQEIKKILYENHKEFEMLAQDAELTASYSNQHKKIVFDVKKEKLGQFIDYPKALNELKINLSKLNFSSIQLNVKTDYPKISKNDCLNIESKAQKIISSAPLVLMYKEKKWSISTEQIAQWLILKKNETNINVEIN
ncbi:peptidoglycan binding domain-containing protein, partial [Patescibacteria group bacterium]|nr:peptidoglycan binding domain-containing protein [Patescibacteria group bacterium]